MKALFYPSFGELVVNDQPVPECEDNEVLFKVAACGICGSELETFQRKSIRRTPPLIMGHEFCGIIVKKGKDVKNWEVGMRAVSNSVISCGKCNYCKEGKTNICIHRQVFGMERNGAFAEYVNVPAHCLFHVPDNLTSKEACLAEPLANGLHIVRLTKHVAARKVMIIGAGSIGLMAQQAFQILRNAEVIVLDLKKERLDVAKRLGATHIINAGQENIDAEIEQLIKREDIDIIIDAAGTKTTQSNALRLVRKGGAAVLIGLHENACALQSYDIILSEKQVLGSYGATREDMQLALQLMADKKANVVSWVNYYSLDEGETAFKDMMMAKNNHIKSVILVDNNLS